VDRGALSQFMRENESPATTALLKQVRRSRNALLLRGLLEVAEARDEPVAQESRLWEHFTALSAAESANSARTTELLVHPHVGAWLAICLKRLIRADHDRSPRPVWADLGYLGAISIAAAVATRTELEAAVPAYNGWAFIPTIGSVRVSDEPGWEMTPVQCLADGTMKTAGDGRLIVPGHADGDLHEVRRLRASSDGLAIDLELDDLDPYRDCHGLGASNRLSDDEVERWGRMLVAAWEILAARHPDTAQSMKQELVTLVPLAVRGVSGISATSRHAPGAVTLTPPRDGISFACSLVHELQHTKLCLFMELAPLGDIAVGQLFYSPWRDDPRPLTGLVHGLYAAVAVANFWRIEYQLGYIGSIASFEHARARLQIEAGLNSLAQIRPLPDSRAAIVTAVRDVAAVTLDAPVPPYYAWLARDITLDHAVRWRLRNLRPSDHDVEALATLWLTGRSPEPSSGQVTFANAGESFTVDTRLRLIHGELLRNASHRNHSIQPPAEQMEASDSDIRLLSGDYGAAAAAYESDIKTGAQVPEAWAGLAVAARGRGDEAAGALISRPELVRAVYENLACKAATAPPAPLEVARWMRPLVAEGTAGWHRGDTT
jgi:HEXXH motif-containing protein